MAINYPYLNPIAGTYHRQVLQEFFAIVDERRRVAKQNYNRYASENYETTITDTDLEDPKLALEATIRHLFITCAYFYRDLDYNPTYVADDIRDIAIYRSWNMARTFKRSYGGLFVPSLSGNYYRSVANEGFFTMDEMYTKWEAHTGPLPILRAINRLKDASYVDFAIDDWHEGRLMDEAVLTEMFLIVKHCMNEITFGRITTTIQQSNNSWGEYNIFRYTSDNDAKIYYGDAIPVTPNNFGVSSDESSVNNALSAARTDFINQPPSSSTVDTRSIRNAVSYSATTNSGGTKYDGRVARSSTTYDLNADFIFDFRDKEHNKINTQKNFTLKVAAASLQTGDWTLGGRPFDSLNHGFFNEEFKVLGLSPIYSAGDYTFGFTNSFNKTTDTPTVTEAECYSFASSPLNKYCVKGFSICSLTGYVNINDSDFVENVVT